MSNNTQLSRFSAISLTKLTATVVGLHQVIFGGFSVIAMEGAPTNQQMVMTALMFGSAMALFLCWRSRMIAGWGAIVFALGLGLSGIIYNYTTSIELEPAFLLIGLLALAGPSLLAGLFLLLGNYSGQGDNSSMIKPSLKPIVLIFIIGAVFVLIIVSLVLGINTGDEPIPF
jgi:hypothetical protein